MLHTHTHTHRASLVACPASALSGETMLLKTARPVSQKSPEKHGSWLEAQNKLFSSFPPSNSRSYLFVHKAI